MGRWVHGADRQEVRTIRRVLMGACLSTLIAACSLAPGSSGNTTAAGGGGAGGVGHSSCAPAAPADTPCGKTVAFFDPLNTFSPDSVSALRVVDQILTSEGYQSAKTFFDSSYGTDNPGDATLASFAALKDYDIVVIVTHGTPQSIGVQWYCDKDKANADGVAAQHAGQAAWYSLISEASPNASCTPDDNGRPSVWAVSVTADGMAHYFDGGHTSLLFLMSCEAYSVGVAAGVPAYFGYPRKVGAASGVFAGCANVTEPVASGATAPPPCLQCGLAGGPNDVQVLFETLAGEYGQQYRTTDAAYRKWLGQWTSDLQYTPAQGSHPLVLSPSVNGTDPGDGGGLVPGQQKKITITFDTAMTESDPVKVEGCGSPKPSGGTWPLPNQYTFNLTVPEGTAGGQMTLTVQASKATAADPGWSNQLDGNQNPADQNAQDPNPDDYVFHLRCSPGLQLTVDGTIGGKPVKGQVVADPGTDLTCVPFGAGGAHPGNVVHWNGIAAGTNTPIAGEFDLPYGTWPLGDAQGDQSITIDEIVPTFTHLSSISGTITQNPGGGSIDAVAAAGADTIHVSGSWTCPSSAGPSPSS